MGKKWDDFTSNTNSALGGSSPANKKADNPFFKTRGKPISGWCEKDRLQARNAFEEFSLAWLKEAYRVLKPGGIIKAFSGTRTKHRLERAMVNVGFEIVTQNIWAYGSGFPKSLNIGKALDKALGVEREVVGEYVARGFSEISPTGDGRNQWAAGIVEDKKGTRTVPATEAAKQWEGWGTALKPAHEPIVVGRKPTK